MAHLILLSRVAPAHSERGSMSQQTGKIADTIRTGLVHMAIREILCVVIVLHSRSSVLGGLKLLEIFANLIKTWLCQR